MEHGFIDHNGVTSEPCSAGSDCPTDCELKELLSGTLDGPRADLVLQISERCDQCDRRLTALERLTASRSSHFTSPSTSDKIASQDAGCRLMLDRLVALWEKEQSSKSLPRFPVACSAKPSTPGETSSNQPSAHGNRFGPYVLLDLIAVGGFGKVDRALDTRLGRVVALKRIQGETKGKAEVLARFQIEATTTAQLSHPGIVRVYEAGEIEGIPFIAMEYVAGASLSAIDFQTPPSPRRCAEICRDVALAIASAHEAGVIHRDLKPSNILIDGNGSPRVTDFGLAKHIQNNEELTTTGQLLGTPSYMAPEQARGAHGQVGRHSDVYSLGAVLYFLLTGQAPFRGSTIVETLRQVTESDPAPPRAINPKTPRDLEILCLKCLEKRPQDRIPSAKEFARQLSLFLAGEPITFRPPRLDERVVRWCQRRPLATAVAVAIPLTILCALLALFWHRHAAKSREALRISTELTATLEEGQFTAETFDRLQILEAQLFKLAPELSTQVSTQIISALHESVHSGLGRNELTDAEFLELEKQIAFLQSRSPELASSLSRALQRRRSDWNWKVRLDDPTTGYESFIDPSLVVADGKGLRMVAPARLVLDQAGRNWGPPTLPTRIACEEDLEIEVQFSDDWSKSTAIGVRIGDDSHAYCEFMLRPLRYSNGTSAFPLAEADRDRVEILAQILVSNQIVRQRSIDLSVLKNGPLRIYARREGRRLYFRLNDLPILTFTHAFLGLSPDAHVSLRLDAATSITALHVRQKSCDDDGVFREADRQYALQRYEDALTRYVEISQPNHPPVKRQEATYKRALCLLALERPAEAISQLSSLALDDGGEHWPSLAAFLLWKLHLDENHEEEARSTANYWHSRFQQSHVDFIPRHFWTSITSHYLTNVRKLSRVTRFDESFSPMLGTLADIDRRVGEHTAGTPEIQVGIANLYRQLEMNEKALTLLNATLPACSTNFLRLNNRILANRVLRQLDRPEEALAVLEQTIQETNSATSDSWFVKAHACTLEQLGRSNESESLVETHLETLGLSSNSLHAIVDLAMIKGVLARRRGDHQAALAAFEHGWKAGRPLLDSRQSLASSAVLNAIIHGCYCDGITQKDIQTLLENSDFRDNPLLVVAKSAVNSETLRRSLLLAWKSPRGLELAADHAFDRLTVHDRFRQPAALMAIGLIAQSLMGGEVDETFSDTLHEHFVRAIDDHLLEKSIGVSQVIQAGLAWKGTTNAFGWAGLKTTLPESQRQLLALILAYRYARIGAAENDRIHLWEEAIAGPDSRLSEFAKLGLQSSRDGAAVLILANDTRSSVVIQLRRVSSDAIEYVALGVPTDGATSRKTIQIPAGDYMLTVTASGSSHEKILGPFSFLPVTRRYVTIQQID